MVEGIKQLERAARCAAPGATRVRAPAAQGSELAQLGRFAAAHECLRELRASAAACDAAAIEAMILEGVIGHFECMAPNSLDRVRRARALAHALQLGEQAARAAAWVAHMAYNFENYSLLAQALEESISSFSELDDEMRARVCLVVANGLQFLGRSAPAAPWYQLARTFSRRSAGHAVQAAVEYNRLAMALGRARIEWALGTCSRAEAGKAPARNWSIEFESVLALHVGWRSTALWELLCLCEAQVLQHEGRFTESITALESAMHRGSGGKCGLSEDLLNLEVEWCRVMSEPLRAPSRSLPAYAELLSRLAPGDRLLGCAFLRDILRQHGGVDADPALRSAHDSSRRWCLESLRRIDDAIVAVESRRDAIEAIACNSITGFK